jgi:hypothetical protein
LDLNEFRSFLTNNLRRSSPNAIGVGSQHTASSYELSSSATYGDTGGAAELTGANFNAAGAGGGGEASYGSYGQPSYALASGGGGGGGEVSYGSYGQSSYALASGGDADAFDANTSSSFGIGGLETNVSSGIDLTTAAVGASSSSTFQVNSSQQQVQVDASNPKNLYQDPNPQIVRRPAPGGGVTYTQNIRVRFLQPPPVPPPGVCFLSFFSYLSSDNILHIIATHHQRSATTSTTSTTSTSHSSTSSSCCSSTSTYLT